VSAVSTWRLRKHYSSIGCAVGSVNHTTILVATPICRIASEADVVTAGIAECPLTPSVPLLTSFTSCNALEGLPFDPETFDVIHVRDFGLAVRYLEW